MNVLMTLGFVLAIGFVVENEAALTKAEKNELWNNMKTLGRQCAKAYPLKLSDWKVFQNKMMPEGNNPKCFTACMFKKVGIMDEAGMVSPTGAREFANQVYKGDEERLNNVDELMKTCSAEKMNEESTSEDDKGCDRAKVLFTCLMDNYAKYGFDTEF